MPFLWAIGFNGQDTGRALLILLGIAVAIGLLAFWAYRRVRRELRTYAEKGRYAVTGARSRIDKLQGDVTSRFSRETPEQARERMLAASIRDWDPSFRLDEFKTARIKDFIQARYLSGEGLRESYLIDANREGDQLTARMRFFGESFEEEWAFAKPVGTNSSWNTIEERFIRRVS